MKLKFFFMLFLAVAFGGFAALIAWTLVIKNQVASSVNAANPLNNLNIFGKS